jgi:uncharacterized protein DUF4440
MYRTVLVVLRVLPWALLVGQSPANAPVSTSDQSGAEREVRQLLKDLAVEHRSKGDAKELERLYADEFTTTNASGQVLDKAAVVAARLSGRIVSQSYEFDDISIRIYGDCIANDEDPGPMTRRHPRRFLQS